MLEQTLIGIADAQSTLAGGGGVVAGADRLLESPGAEGAVANFAEHGLQAAAFAFQGQELLIEIGSSRFQGCPFLGGFQQAVAGAEPGQFALELAVARLELGSLVVQEGKTIGQALLPLLLGGLQISGAELLEQALGFSNLAAGDGDLENAVGGVATFSSLADADALRELFWGGVELLGDGTQQQRTLQHLDQGWNVVAGGVAGQLFKHGAAAGSDTALAGVLAEGIGDQQGEGAGEDRVGDALNGGVEHRQHQHGSGAGEHQFASPAQNLPEFTQLQAAVVGVHRPKR